MYISVKLILIINFTEVVQLMLLEHIERNYKPGELFLLKKLNLNISYDNLCQQIKGLADSGRICRYMDGVYYRPKKTISGIPYVPNSDKVAELKYITDNYEYYGCYSGHTLSNMIGLSNQVPQVKEIISNNTKAITREVSIGKFNYIIRRACFPITQENVKTVMLLEILKDIENLSDVETNKAECLRYFILQNKITKKMVDGILPNYPLRTYKAIYDLELTNAFA